MPRTPLEELIRRYEAGDRDPELIRELNDAAWDGFHDPWEAKAVRARHPVTGELVPLPAPEPVFDPTASRPFTADTLRRFLDAKPYRYWTSARNAFLVTFTYAPRTDRCLMATFSVVGKREDVFRLQITPDRRVPTERFDRALRLCNAWNEGYRWPRAILSMPDLEKDEDAPEGLEPASALLTLDFQLFLRAGIPQALFDSMVLDALATSWDFWQLAHDEYGM
jgi:hypothetical protein